MIFDFTKLTNETAELAYSSIAFTAGQRAAQLALSDILKEQKLAKERSIDAANGLIDAAAEEDEQDEHTDEIGHEAKATFEDWCALLATANDELVTLANGGKWPRAQDVAGLIDWMKKATPAPVTDDAKAGLVAMMEAYNKGKPNRLSDAEVATLVADEAKAKAEFFASLYAEHGDDIRDRILDQIANTSATVSFQTALNRLPKKQLAQLMASIVRKIDTKCDELLTGKRRNGSVSPTSKIPMIARAGMISVLRGDQDDVKTAATLLEHAA